MPISRVDVVENRQGVFKRCGCDAQRAPERMVQPEDNEQQQAGQHGDGALAVGLDQPGRRALPAECLTRPMRKLLPQGREVPAAVRVAVAAPIGLAAAALIGVTAAWKYAPAAGWIAGAAVYLVWTWLVAGRMSPEQTAAHATRADTTGSMTDATVVSASVASLAGVGYLLIAESVKGGQAYGAAAVGIGSVVVSWVAIHTVFTLRYAQLYYSGTPGGIDFNQPEPPAYVDFAYLAFTIGMAFQVSDTDLQTRKIRATALRQALLSYVFGVVIVAMAINLIMDLSHRTS